MKVLIICNIDSFLVSHRLNLIKYLVSLKHDVAVLTHDSGATANLKAIGIKVYEFDKIRGNINIIKLSKNLKTCISTIKDFRPDLIHTVTISSFVTGALINIFYFRLPMTIAISGLGPISTLIGIKGKLLRLMTSSLYYLSSLLLKTSIIVQNDSDRKYIEFVTDKRKTKIFQTFGSGVNLDEFKFSNSFPDQLTFIYASRLCYKKGVMDFFHAAERLSQDFLNINFLVAGSWDHEGADSITKEDFQKIRDSKSVNYMGNVQPLLPLLLNSSVLVLPTSYGEGLPRILLEAIALGRPIITSNHPSVTQCVENSINGFILESSSIEILCRAMLEYVNDKTLLLKHSNGNKKFLLKCDEQDVLKVHLLAYEYCLS